MKRDGGLFPYEDEGFEVLKSIRDGRRVMVSARPARNPKHHNLLFKLLAMACDAGAWDGDVDDLKDVIKYRFGYVRKVVTPDGATHLWPKSIAFESMDQTSFNRFFDRAVWFLCCELLGSDDWESLRNEIIEVCEGQYHSNVDQAA